MSDSEFNVGDEVLIDWLAFFRELRVETRND